MSRMLDEPLDAVLSELFGDIEGWGLVIGPSQRTFEALIDVMTAAAAEEPPRIRVLGAEATIKETVQDFLIAGHAADLIEDDTLEIRTLESPPGHGIVVTGDRVVSVVRAGERAAVLGTDDATFGEAARSFYEAAWDDAEPFGLRTPPLSRVRESMRAEIGEEVAADFDAALTALGTARGEEELDEVTVSLLVAAKHRELLYDISKWGEDIGIASKATFSRTKTTLEERGVIDTEKVPIDVGRPRLRLKFADERLQDADGTELANVAQSVTG